MAVGSGRRARVCVCEREEGALLAVHLRVEVECAHVSVVDSASVFLPDGGWLVGVSLV